MAGESFSHAFLNGLLNLQGPPTLSWGTPLGGPTLLDSAVQLPTVSNDALRALYAPAPVGFQYAPVTERISIAERKVSSKPPPGPGLREEDRRAVVLRRWLPVLSMIGDHGEVSQQFQDCPEAQVDALLENLFALKATGTIEKRASSIGLFLKWQRTRYGVSIFPSKEAHIYEYCEWCRISGAPPTRSQGLIEAINFCSGVFGFASGGLISMRVRGSAERAMEAKRLTVHAPALTAEAVYKLEEFVCGDENVHSRVFAGFLLFLIYARMRCSDGAQILQEPIWDAAGERSGFVETIATRTKTSRRAKRARMGLPIVAPRAGLFPLPWAEAWLVARKAAGLHAQADGALMPAKDIHLDGNYIRGVAMGPAQVTFFGVQLLRELMDSSANTASFTSHSCKATALSWLAKAGAKMEHRRLLGGHAKPGEKVPLVYSRDALAGPLRTLENVISAIVRGHFAPDKTRSGRWCADAGADKLGDVQLVSTVKEAQVLARKLHLSETEAPSGQSAQLSPRLPTSVVSSSGSSRPGTSASSSSAAGDFETGLGGLLEEEELEYSIAAGTLVHNITSLKKHLLKPTEDTTLCGLINDERFQEGAAKSMTWCEKCLNFC